MRGELPTMRSKILQKQEGTLKSLDQSLRAKHQEHTNLRNKVLPRAEKRVAALRERAASMDEEIRQLQKEVEEINQIDLDALFPESRPA